MKCKEGIIYMKIISDLVFAFLLPAVLTVK